MDWEWQAALWNDAFIELDIDPSKHRMVVTGSANLLTGEGKEKIEDILHYEFKVPALRIETAATAILVGCARQTGIVVDMGNQLEIAAIAHGYPVPRAGFVSTFGGLELTKRLNQELRSWKIETSNMDLVRKIKEECCQTRQADETGPSRGSKEKMCRLPADVANDPDVEEGGHDELPVSALWEGVEAVFQDVRDERGLHEHIADAIDNCDQSLKPEMYRNIILAGGSTCFRGFETRLEEELRTYLTREVSSKAGAQCQIIIKKHRKYLAWQGAAAMAIWDRFWDDENVTYGPGAEGELSEDESNPSFDSDVSRSDEEV